MAGILAFILAFQYQWRYGTVSVYCPVSNPSRRRFRHKGQRDETICQVQIHFGKYGCNSDYNMFKFYAKNLTTTRRTQRHWSPEAEIILLGVQLSIYTHQLEHSLPHDAPHSNRSSSHKQESTNDIVVNIVFAIAVRLSDAFHSITITDPNSATPQRYLPSTISACSLS